jgi:hypothetical protein
LLRNKTFALVIQGPLISSGNSGAGNNISSYDCIPNIKRYIENFSGFINSFIVTTWEKDASNFIGGLTSAEVDLLSLYDPGPNITLTNHTRANDYRQFYASYMGVKRAIELCNPDYILKVRTDQYLDILEMCNHMLNVDSVFDDYESVEQQGFIFLPNILNWTPYSAGDFYIGGHARDLYNFFDAQCEYKNHSFTSIFPWIHSDFILKHAYGNLVDKLGLKNLHYFPNIAPSFRVDIHGKPKNFKYHMQTIFLWSELLKKSLCIFEKNTALNLEWRGEKFSFDQHSVGQFYEEWKEMKPDPQVWLLRNRSDQYLKKSKLEPLQELIHFSHAKRLEIQTRKQSPLKLILQITQFILCIFTGQFPRNQWLLRKWVKFDRGLKKIGFTS